jgi:peroxiredoxin
LITILYVSSILLWVVTLINFLLILALIRRINIGSGVFRVPFDTLPIGQMAPDFIADGITGEQITLANYAGRALALVFVSPNCGVCSKQIPQINLLGTNAISTGTELLIICNADVTQTQSYEKKLNITVPVLSAPRQTNPFFENYKASGVPFYVIIDQQGLIQATNLVGDYQWNEFVRKHTEGGVKSKDQ